MRQYLLKKDVYDERDFITALDLAARVKIPTRVDLRPKCPPVFDQGKLGSCSANAGVGAKMMLSSITTLLSRLFLYYQERSLANNINVDSGASMRDICKALAKFGVCEEAYAPYIIENFATPPTADALANALKYKIGAYKKLDTLSQIKEYIATHQKPVMIGMKVFSGMETEAVAKSGLLPMPKTGEQMLGGHAVLVAGYKDSSRLGRLTTNSQGYLIVRNSWGSGWGDKGYFYMPYEYMAAGNTFDYWVIE